MCTTRITKAHIDVSIRGVAVGAHPRRIGYLQSNLFDSSEPHQKSYRRSLSPRFRSACHAFRHTVSPAFAFSLNGGFPTRLSRALATFVSLSKATVQSNYPPAAVRFRVSRTTDQERCYIVAPRGPQPPLRRSRLRYAWPIVQQLQAIVKLHGDFISH